MFPFTTNYPVRSNAYTILTTPQRARSHPDYTGRGVVMAFIDSGFFPHPDLDARIVCHVDASSGRVVEAARHFTKPEWYCWHGQMTTVIAAGAGKSFPGVVPDAQLVLVKVSNYKRQIKERDIERGLAWILANHRRFGIRIVNISVGGDDVSTNPDHPLHRIVQQLAEEGVITVVAAGNFAAPILLPPASAPLAITVGGLDDQNSLNPADWLPYGSNWGVVYDGTPKPEVIAPARWIASPLLPGTREAQMGEWLFPMVGADEATVRALLRQGYAALGLTYNQGQNPDSTVFHTLQRLIHKHKLIDSTHQHVDGTSVSAPIVAATIAQMLETHPGLDVHEVRALLTASADILPGIPAERQGGGLLNPLDAVKRSQSVPETALAHGSG